MDAPERQISSPETDRAENLERSGRAPKVRSPPRERTGPRSRPAGGLWLSTSIGFRSLPRRAHGMGVRISDLEPRARHGLVVRDRSGLSTSAWYRAIRRGDLIAVQPNVARLPGAPIDQTQRIAAAVWSAGGGALASHRSAAHLWGFERATPELEVVDVILPVRSKKLRLDGVATHRPTDHRRLRPQRRDGIRCTNPLRTLVDLGAVAPDLVEAFLGHALAARLVSIRAATTALHQHAERGRSGITALRDAIETWAIDAKPADSLLEAAFVRLVRRHRLPEFVFHPIVEGWEVDFRFVGTPLIVECDGWTSHGLDRSQFERDRRRDADLAAAGFVVLRCTYRAITAEPAETARRIRRVLDRNAVAPDSRPA